MRRRRRRRGDRTDGGDRADGSDRRDEWRWRGGGGGGGTEITIEGFAFNPSTITVSGSTEVAVTNNDTTAHTFTLDDGSADLALAAGESGAVTVDVSETTGFHCAIHPSMTGTVEVA